MTTNETYFRVIYNYATKTGKIDRRYAASSTTVSAKTADEAKKIIEARGNIVASVIKL